MRRVLEPLADATAGERVERLKKVKIMLYRDADATYRSHQPRSAYPEPRDPASRLLGESLLATIKVSGSTSPYQFSVTSGALPPGLSLDTSKGVISGSPTTIGSDTFTVTATDSSSTPNTGSQIYTIKVTNCIT